MVFITSLHTVYDSQEIKRRDMGGRREVVTRSLEEIKQAHYHFTAAVTVELRYSQPRTSDPLNLTPALSQIQFRIKVHNVKARVSFKKKKI